MRGDRELNCLEAVRDMVFCYNGQPRQDPITHKTYLDVTEDEFKKARIHLVNSECRNSYFGLLEQHREEFEDILRKAKPNPDASSFPDFIFENGFIEHFRVTSSSVTRKGATHVRQKSEFHRTVDAETQKLVSEWNETPSFDTVRSQSWSFPNPKHSYDFLVDSFKRNWEHHMESYEKYAGPKQVGIFMIEYPEFALAMYENVYQGWIDGMSDGDMREEEDFKEYRLSRDKRLLEYIYQYKDEIQCVVFWNHARFEVIRTENIPYLIKLLPWEYCIYPLNVTTVDSLHNISVPEAPPQGEESDDKT